LSNPAERLVNAVPRFKAAEPFTGQPLPSGHQWSAARSEAPRHFAPCEHPRQARLWRYEAGQ
jgi:hypothetical protein